jgi:DNA (cytosine-5)-methyltransferase 1
VCVTVEQIIGLYRTEPRDFDWACGDLSADPASTFDRPSTPKAVTKERIDYLFDNGLYELPNHMRPACHRDGHTYPSVYGRIKPDEPAPTITTGFMTMGQGRFVHPHERRTLTAHEGARIQCFPDWFDFGERSRQAYITLIGNAVPPKLAYVIALELLR